MPAFSRTWDRMCTCTAERGIINFPGTWTASGSILAKSGCRQPVKGFMRSGELARLSGVSTDTLRHYESLGLLPVPARTRGNYRDYPPQSIARVRLIRNALSMGFSLQELGGIIQSRDQGEAPCREVRRLAGEKIT